MITAILIPLINPNEIDALIAAVHVQEGALIKQSDLLCTLETTKSTFELCSDVDGYCVGIKGKQGITVLAGDVFGYIVDSLETWEREKSQLEKKPKLSALDEAQETLPDGLRITKPALALLQKYKIDAHLLPLGAMITVDYLRGRFIRDDAKADDGYVHDMPENAIVVVGGGGHGKTVIEMLRAVGGYRIIGILDDGLDVGCKILEVPVLGWLKLLSILEQQGLRYVINAVGGISRLQIRKDVFIQIAEAKLQCPTLVHPRAFVEPSAKLAEGVQVFPLAYVGSEAEVGFGCIINTAAVVSHDCVLGDYVNLSPNVSLAGEVEVGEMTLIGMGVTVNLRVKVGRNAKIGNGATVKGNVQDGGIVHAGSVFPER